MFERHIRVKRHVAHRESEFKTIDIKTNWLLSTSKSSALFETTCTAQLGE